ncbi:MAG: AAA family ATPase, partial [Chloroflexi bacterium]|nr:AAA family ATPase [Chloroflexota bacterium]
MTGLRVRVLGGFSVEVAGRPLPDAAWRRNRARALVKLLAIAPGQRLQREQLMDALWPDLEPDVAAANLRKALHFARAALGADHLPARGPQIALEAEPLWIDAVAFETEVGAGRGDRALELYAGELLPEDRYEPWTEEPRERLQAQARRARMNRAAELERAGDLARATEVLERLVADDALNEDAHLALIRVLGLAGERNAAVRQYRALEAALRDELGVEPSPAARGLYERLLSGVLAAVPLAAGDAAPAAGPDDVAEARKLVTVMWLDILSLEPDPERARRALDDWSTTALERLAAAGASAEAVPGGSVLAIFGIPAVREDDASRALDAAIDLSGLDSSTRIGVATGEVIAAMGSAPGVRLAVGPAIQEAGRLRELATAGSVLTSERTASAAGRAFRFETGADDRSWRLVGRSTHEPSAARRLPDPPLVGRAGDLAAALNVVEAGLDGTAPRVVVIVGAAGVGKSRLAREIVSSARIRPTTPRAHVARCQPGGRAGPYAPLGDVLRAACGISLSASRARMERALRQCLDRLFPDATPDEREATLRALGTSAGIALANNPLDDLAPGEVAQRLSLAWPRFASALAAEAPTLLLVED